MIEYRKKNYESQWLKLNFLNGIRGSYKPELEKYFSSELRTKLPSAT